MRSFIFSLSLLLLGCSSGTQISPHAGTMIVPGVGTDEIHVDMSKAEITGLLGEPEAVSNEGRWLDYRESLGLNFFLGDAEHVAEVRFTQGFRGRLPSRITINSRMLDVFTAYGTPAARVEVSDQAVGRKDRVLYKSPGAYKISYNRLGLSFWFSLHKRVTQIVVFKPLPNRNLRVEPQKSGDSPSRSIENQNLFYVLHLWHSSSSVYNTRAESLGIYFYKIFQVNSSI